MRIIKPQSLGLLHKPYTYLGKYYLSIAALGFFRLGADNPRFLTENLQWPHVMASLPPGMPLDEVMPRQQAEVLLLGSAYAPQQQACTSLLAQLRVDDADGRALVSKCLCISGEREWRAGVLGARRVSKPKPFTSMALSYRRAYGGARNDVNPEGCGERPAGAWLSACTGLMPNISYPHTIAADWRASVAAGFGPIPIGNRTRRKKFGSYGAAWRKNDAPGFARDMDWSVFNMAPPDQWSERDFRGGEAYLLRNLHARHGELMGKLPDLRARAFLLENGKTIEDIREVSLRMDTVWFLPDYDLGIAIYHGQTEINDSDALDISALMVAYEGNTAPKSEQHYRDVMALRLDRESGRLHVFNESQLAPLPDEAERQRREQEQKAAEDAVLARSQQRIDLLDAQYWASRGVSAPAGHRTARATLPVLGVMTARTAAEGDFDVSDIVAKARALAAQVEQAGKEALARIPQITPVVADVAKMLATALARAAVPAYDLLPAGQTGCDPQLAAMLTQLQLPPDGATPAAIKADQAARANIMKIPAHRRQSRRAAPKVVLPALPYPQSVALELGAQIQAWLRTGVALAGRDLAGASLAGVDFAGADLREVMLDGADLSGASFVGANMQGAVLVGAKLDDADFSNCNLQQANLCASHGRNIRFDGADLEGVQALDAQWPRAGLRGARLRRLLAIRLQCPGAQFDQADLGKAMLFDVEADGTSWRQTQMKKTVFLRANLQDADFSQAQLLKVVFNNANVQRSRWDGALLDEVQGGAGSNWNGAGMVGAVLKKCGFHGAEFTHVDARQAQFLRCDFSKADLRWGQFDAGQFSYCGFLKADLRMVSASAAEFFQCLCRKTDFSGAQLASTVFAQCELTEAIEPIRSAA
ncbi:putative low-complexity protein [Herbaspirillum sp. CF444]|uniref:DUF2169 family type VI secretion system accessory protein n=1 Tax=Herbaspirillum sp. CF444 TaxID=1144319 RepID=UPI0002726875|nr:DUF2169 domain-containing protein [Herbaspirillum sp. CF444]EJL94085.1 putative low-complexity protein [Herbaspirillum sp. CF444]